MFIAQTFVLGCLVITDGVGNILMIGKISTQNKLFILYK